MIALILILAAHGLLFLGLMFLINPARALRWSDHTTEQLPGSFGGRYIMMGALLIAAVVSQEPIAIVTLLCAFGALGLLDAWLHRGGRYWLHLAAGMLSLGVAVLIHLQNHEVTS